MIDAYTASQASATARLRFAPACYQQRLTSERSVGFLGLGDLFLTLRLVATCWLMFSFQLLVYDSAKENEQVLLGVKWRSSSFEHF
jgi:hypothetical protein